jgi:hypothetical protein
LRLQYLIVSAVREFFFLGNKKNIEAISLQRKSIFNLKNVPGIVEEVLNCLEHQRKIKHHLFRFPPSLPRLCCDLHSSPCTSQENSPATKQDNNVHCKGDEGSNTGMVWTHDTKK